MYSIPEPATQTIPHLENIFKAILFPTAIAFLLFVSNLQATQFDSIAASAHDSSWVTVIKWLIIIILVTACTILMNAMGVLAHDGVHRVLVRNYVTNDILSSLLSAFTLIPFFANRKFHLNHHRYAHQPGLDPENEIHERPFMLAFFAGPFFAMLAQYKIVFRNLFNFKEKNYQLQAIADLVFISLSVSSYRFFITTAGLDLHYTLYPLLAILPLSYNFRAMSDHYGVAAVSNENTTPAANNEANNHNLSSRVILTNPILEWLWSHVNYHEIHHKYPYLSHTHLPLVYKATRDQFKYSVVHGYTRSLLALRKLNYYP